MASLHLPALYLPRRRLGGAAVGAAFGGRPPRGSRSVAAWDEDVVTMAVAAGRAALANAGEPELTAVFVASCTAPLVEKSTAAFVAAGLGVDGVRADDFGGGLRAGLAALAAAVDATDADEDARVLVIAAERRTEAPGTPAELRVGDGAAALVVGGPDGPLAVRGQAVGSHPLAAQWKRAGEPFRRNTDARFASVAGEGELVPEALQALSGEETAPIGELTRATVSSLDARAVGRLLKQAGVGESAAMADELQGVAGHLGAAHPLALLALLVDGATAGSQLALASGSDGLDAWWFEATADVGSNGGPPAPDEGEEIQHYGRYLRERGLLPEAPATPMEPFTSTAMLHREAASWWAWHGRQCVGCGTVLVLPLPACHRCRGEEFDEVALAKSGTVFTSTAEYYVPSPEPPTGMLVVDLDPFDGADGAGGGGRATVQWAGAAGPLPAVGDRVELVLRKYHEAEGLPHYWWKAVPA